MVVWIVRLETTFPGQSDQWRISFAWSYKQSIYFFRPIAFPLSIWRAGSFLKLYYINYIAYYVISNKVNIVQYTELTQSDLIRTNS